MKILTAIFSVFLVIYSLGIALVSLLGTESCLRYFLTDITGSCGSYGYLPFFGINTTFSVFLLWSAVFLFKFSWDVCMEKIQTLNRSAYEGS